MIIQGYYPRVGGAERQVQYLAPLLQEQNVDVHIITRRYKGLAPFEMVSGVPVHRITIPGPKPTASIAFTIGALRVLRRLQPDVIHAHELFSPATTAVAAKRLFEKPVAVTVHRGGYLGDVARLKGKAFGDRRIANLRKHFDTFVTISHEIDAELAEVDVPIERRVFIPNGVDTDRFTPLESLERDTLRARLGLDNGPVVVFSGRLADEKRVNLLISIWPALRVVHPNAQLLVLGTGPKESELKHSAGAGIEFKGLVDDVAPFLQAADLFVLPSIAEGLSVALLEAMATGTPAIATAVGGAPDVIEQGVSGWLVPPDDERALREAIVTLLDDPMRRKSLGMLGRERVVDGYALMASADKLRNMYDLLIEGAPDMSSHFPLSPAALSRDRAQA